MLCGSVPVAEDPWGGAVRQPVTKALLNKMTKTQCKRTVFLCFNSHLNDNSNSFIIWFGRKENSFSLPLFSIDYDILSHFQFVVTVHNANSAL